MKWIIGSLLFFSFETFGHAGPVKDLDPMCTTCLSCDGRGNGMWLQPIARCNKPPMTNGLGDPKAMCACQAASALKPCLVQVLKGLGITYGKAYCPKGSPPPSCDNDGSFQQRTDGYGSF